MDHWSLFYRSVYLPWVLWFQWLLFQMSVLLFVVLLSHYRCEVKDGYLVLTTSYGRSHVCAKSVHAPTPRHPVSKSSDKLSFVIISNYNVPFTKRQSLCDMREATRTVIFGAIGSKRDARLLARAASAILSFSIPTFQGLLYDNDFWDTSIRHSSSSGVVLVSLFIFLSTEPPVEADLLMLLSSLCSPDGFAIPKRGCGQLRSV